MSSVIRPKDDIAVSGQAVDIGDVALGRLIHVGRDETVVEDDHRPAVGRLFRGGGGGQGGGGGGAAPRPRRGAAMPRGGRLEGEGEGRAAVQGYARAGQLLP